MKSRGLNPILIIAFATSVLVASYFVNDHYKDRLNLSVAVPSTTSESSIKKYILDRRERALTLTIDYLEAKVKSQPDRADWTLTKSEVRELLQSKGYTYDVEGFELLWSSLRVHLSKDFGVTSFENEDSLVLTITLN